MRAQNRTTKVLIAVASFALIAAACGSDATDSAPATDAPAATPASTEMDDEMSDETTDEMDDEMSDEMDDEMSDEMSDEMAGPSGPLCSAVPADGEGSFAGMTDDTAATAASNNPVLSTLVAAVQAAGLVDTLNSDGPFTIFAPANPAFDALPAGTLDAVLADTDLLTSILTLHVVAGEQLSSADLAELDSVTTVNGADIALEVAEDGTLMVNGQASVGCADIQTSNATVHVIDAVLMP
jgi:transforming growth factor-beta-induced protein